jgi:hypothetical protein
VNAHSQLDFGFPHPPSPAKVETLPQKEPRVFPRRIYYGPSFAATERKNLERFLSWQAQAAYDAGVPLHGPI